MIESLTRLRKARTGRASSWDTSGRNGDSWTLKPGEARTLAEIDGPGAITHLWMTQPHHYRECLLRFTWDHASDPSVAVPLGDFFCLGHGMVTSFQNYIFSASTRSHTVFEGGCALNCYARMPFREHARIELVNESGEPHRQYFYIDYEQTDVPEDAGYFHAEFRRENPFGGWGPEIPSNRPGSHLANIVNKKRTAWENNYVILETKGRGHYIGCNLSVTNFAGDWWGEGDDMIWVDGYKWPPDLHGTGSEDYLNQAYGMQANAFLRNGSSIFEGNTCLHGPTDVPWGGKGCGGYQTSYVLHVENPVCFTKEIKVTIEHGHGNHLANEMSSVAYWYAQKPSAVAAPPPVAKRMPVPRDNRGNWIHDKKMQITSHVVPLTKEMKKRMVQWEREQKKP